MTSRIRLPGATGLVAGGLLLVLAAALPAAAQDSLRVEVEQAEFGDTQTQLTVTVQGVEPGEVDPTSFTVTEGATTVSKVAVEQAASAVNAPQQSVMLAMDTSDSTAGEPREQSIAAAKEFARVVMQRGVSVGVVAFHGEVELLLPPSQDVQEVVATLDDMPGGRGTLLNDAVRVAAATLADLGGQRTVVLFTDGTDQGSEATLADAVNTVGLSGASVTSVALQTPLLDTGALQTLATNSGGRVIEVQGAGGLQAAFKAVADTLNNRYVLTYPTTDASGQVEVEVAYSRGGSRAADSLSMLKPEQRGETAPSTSTVQGPGPLATSTVATGAVAAAGVGLALLLLALFVPVGDRQVARNLQVAVGSGNGKDAAPREDLSPTTAAMSRRAVELIERIPKPEGYDAALQLRIDRAAWPLRSTEFTTLRAIVALVAFGLGWAVVNLVFGFLLAAIGWVVPNIVLGVRLAGRQKKFMDQLPDTLQLLAGSMKAGYGVLQAIDTVVKESPEPTRGEFQRVLAEARLGLPLDDSLMEMADRVGTDDFRWVAVSISIQRRVGGNLAQLLETVAATLRERASTRRQISALAAEGKLSAYVLVGLPFALGLYMFVSNPEYVAPLYTSGVGQVMLAGAALLMSIGIYVMKNMIEIDV